VIPPLPDDLFPGVTVLVRTYKGVERIRRTLDSLCAQTLDSTQFEVLVVPNGPDDGTAELLRRYRIEHPELDLRVVRSHAQGIGTSMNVGLAAARREYLTVVDDDDIVSARFLEGLFTHANPAAIAHGYLANLEPDGRGPADFDTYVNRGLAPAIGQTVHPWVVPTSLMFNVCKLVWTPYARAVRARENLRFATDVVYWHELVNTFNLEICVLAAHEHTVYYRSLRTGSHSRPTEAPYELAIKARLDAIEALLPMALDPTSYVTKVARLCVDSQAEAMGRYLRDHPDEHSRVIAEVDHRGMHASVFRPLNRKRARDLVTCYTFVPSNNTSALVAARRVRERGVCVDVVSHDMSGVHDKDPAANVIVRRHLGDRKTVQGKPRFSNWPGMVDYCLDGMEVIEEWEANRGVYRSVYSRAMWPASHVLGALYKIRRPDTKWIAEFSDPLSENISGDLRKGGKRGDDALSRELEEAMREAGHLHDPQHTLLQWVEHLAYALADEIIFTNVHQQTTMLQGIATEELRAQVRERSTISAHPTLPGEFYDMSDVAYPLEPGKVHLAYFGAFYPTRGLTEVTDAIRAMPRSARDRLKVHVFTKDPADLRKALRKADMHDTVVVNNYVPYLDFLHLTTLFDCLLVNDARTTDTHEVNPYLPSKVSDYAGSGTPIWAVVEPGSVLSQRDVAFTSNLGDVDGALEVLAELTAR